MVSRAARVLAAVVVCAVGAGCTGVPSGGPVRIVRRVPPEELDAPEPRVRRIAPNPAPDAPPDDIVRGYLTAQIDPADGYAVARRYLAPQVEWQPNARAVVYVNRRLGAPVVSGDRATIAVTLDPVVGTIAQTGEFRPRTAPVSVTFRLRRLPDVGWRLAEAPPGLLVGRADVATTFQRATLYWPDQARRLVPSPVFLPTSEQPVASVVRALLAGPRGWVAPAVRTAIPAGTELLAPPEVVDGVATLKFSREIGRASQETLRTLVAQVVWTLTDRADVDVVRLFAENDPLDVPGRPGLRDHRRNDWLDHAPVPATADRRLFFVRDGVPYATDEAGRVSRLADTPPLASVAVNRGGTTLAAVTRPSGGRQSLLVYDLTGREPVRTVTTADRITPPTWEPGGDVVWVTQSSDTGQQVVAAPSDGRLFMVVPVPAALPTPVTALRLSPDGARAALVAGAGAGSALWLARVERPASGGRVLGAPIRVAPGVRGVTAAAFDGAAHLLVASRTGERPALHRLELDGFALEQQRDAGLPAGVVTALAVSAGFPADRVASTGDRMWRRTPGAEWAALRSRGVSATFAG